MSMATPKILNRLDQFRNRKRETFKSGRPQTVSAYFREPQAPLSGGWSLGGRVTHVIPETDRNRLADQNTLEKKSSNPDAPLLLTTNDQGSSIS